MDLMDLDAVPGVVAGGGSSSDDCPMRHQTAPAPAPAIEQAPCLPASSTVLPPVAVAPAFEELSFPPRRGKPEWVMLDCFIRHLNVEDSTLAYEFTSAGDIIGVGFRATAPPETSRLVFDLFPGEMKKKKKKGQRFGFRRDGRMDSSLWPPDAAKAVAAHRNSMLLRFLVPSRDGRHEEFFIYRPDPASLKRLGPCGHEFINCYAENNVGILCREEDDEFAAAHLTVTPQGRSIPWSATPVTGELCYMLSKDGSWRTRCLPVRHGEGKGDGLVWWQTDAVIAFRDTICWVDYLRGMLFCDVFSPDPELRYVPLPVTPCKGSRNPQTHDRGGVFAYRNVCVTQEGAIRFIDATTSNLWFSDSPCRCSPSNFTSWTLSNDQVTWIRDGAIEVDKFYYLAKSLSLPQVQQPMFPLVDMKYPQIVYFAVRGKRGSGTLLVPANMQSSTLGRPTAYALGNFYSRDEDGSYLTSCNLFFNEPFLPCEFA